MDADEDRSSPRKGALWNSAQGRASTWQFGKVGVLAAYPPPLTALARPRRNEVKAGTARSGWRNVVRERPWK